MKRLRDAAAVVEAGFYSSLDGWGGVVVEWDGEPEYLLHSAAMYLDEALLRDRKRDALQFLDHVEEFMDATTEMKSAAIPYIHVLIVPRADPLPFKEVVSTRLASTFQAHTTVRPRLAFPKVLRPTFWAYWNKIVKTIGDEEPDAVASIRDNLLHQCAYYREHGFKARKLGQAVWHAAGLGASDRLSTEVAELAGLSLEEFRALPTTERHRLTDEYTNRSSLGLTREDE